jgi:coenzyme F420-0:L-glutamate ligase/coenzyme F420-1:gamma-L-glutamate ligase
VTKQLTFTAIEGIPLILPGDNIASLIYQLIQKNSIPVVEGDIFVFAQKIISKAEGRIIDFSDVVPSELALELAKKSGKDPRFVEIVLSESKKVIRVGVNTLIVEHKNGFICANAGVDHSNVTENIRGSENIVLLLPEDSDASAEKLRDELENLFGVHLGILIIDSHGRAWRNGTVGITIGVAGVPALVDLRGNEDLFGFKLKVTTVGAADELAAGASLLMGQAAEGTPCVLAHGFPFKLRESSLGELLRPENEDLFR